MLTLIRVQDSEYQKTYEFNLCNSSYEVTIMYIAYSN